VVHVVTRQNPGHPNHNKGGRNDHQREPELGLPIPSRPKPIPATRPHRRSGGCSCHQRCARDRVGAARRRSGQPIHPTGPGSVAGAPNLPPAFTDTFTDRYVDVGGVRLHAVVGGHGRPLLLVHGWPQTWYAWRLLMPALAGAFQVVAVDQRGIGLSDKPPDGYDTGTQAKDMVKPPRTVAEFTRDYVDAFR
jgi:hypothetical protein